MLAEAKSGGPGCRGRVNLADVFRTTDLDQVCRLGQAVRRDLILVAQLVVDHRQVAEGKRHVDGIDDGLGRFVVVCLGRHSKRLVVEIQMQAVSKIRDVAMRLLFCLFEAGSGGCGEGET